MNMHAQLKAAMEVATNNAERMRIDSSCNQTTTHVDVTPPVNIAGNVGIGTTNDDDVTPPVNALPSVDDVTFKNISDRAMLFKLQRSMFNTNVKDVDKSVEYGAGHVTKKLFKGDNLVSDARSAYDAVYTYVMENTLPWDVGVRLVNASFFREFSTEVRRLTTIAETAVSTLEANWTQVKDADYQRIQAIGRTTNNPYLASYDDYPDDIGVCYSIRTQLTPIAQTSSIDPRWGVSDDDIEDYKQLLADANANSGKSVIANLIEPQEAAVKNLSRPVEEVKKFYTSVVTNMTDVAARMHRANVCDDPVVAECITDLSTLAGKLNTDVLKHNQTARDAAVADISSLMGKMKGLV